MDFAANKMKLQRAIEETTKENGGVPAAEDVVKARYIKLGGLLTEEEEVKTAVPRSKMKAPSLKDVKARPK